MKLQNNRRQLSNIFDNWTDATLYLLLLKSSMTKQLILITYQVMLRKLKAVSFCEMKNKLLIIMLNELTIATVELGSTTLVKNVLSN